LPVRSRNSREFRRLWGYSVGFLAVWIVYIGLRQGLFEAIAAKRFDRRSLAEELKLFFPAVDSWCSAAIGLDLVNEKQSLAISPKMKDILLDTQSAENIGGMYSYLALKSLQYGKLDGLFRMGRTVSLDESYEAIDCATEWDHAAFVRSLR